MTAVMHKNEDILITRSRENGITKFSRFGIYLLSIILLKSPPNPDGSKRLAAFVEETTAIFVTRL
tara:strand:- start:586 stop:780 length:195 start_codon:yes stop_codon:yes gene_type:complete